MTVKSKDHSLESRLENLRCRKWDNRKDVYVYGKVRLVIPHGRKATPFMEEAGIDPEPLNYVEVADIPRVVIEYEDGKILIPKIAVLEFWMDGTRWTRIDMRKNKQYGGNDY